MLLSLAGGCSGKVRRGDVVFDTREHEPGFPVHVGIHVGESCEVTGAQTLSVQGVPVAPKQTPLGTATWGNDGQYQPDVVGQRLDVDETQVSEVALLGMAMEAEASQVVRGIRWATTRRIDATIKLRDGIGLFVRGTCSHYVHYLYQCAGIDLLDADKTFDPKATDRVHPTALMHALFTGTYPLECAWDDRLGQWPGCLFGTASTTR